MERSLVAATSLLVLGMLAIPLQRMQQVLPDEPYMDEVYHIKQAQAYCSSIYGQWDNKITTYPGLYLLSSGLHHLLGRIGGSQLIGSTCSVLELRLINSLLVAMTYVACVLCRLRDFSAEGGRASAHLYALLVVAYPFSAFYYSLYYTDTASTFALVLMYYVSTRRARTSQIASFLLSTAAVSVRQTNAVWVLFAAGTNMLRQLHENKVLSTPEALSAKPYWNQLANFMLALLRNVRPLARSNAGLLSTVVWFAVLVLKSGSVVVGDKENHQPTGFHAAMPLHLAAVAAAILAPTLFIEATTALKCGKFFDSISLTSILATLFGSACCSAALVFGSIEHPFLLADNRHYTFYLWRRVLRFPEFRAMLGPGYYLCLQFVVRRLRAAGRSPLWITIFAAACVISLSPTPLLEPRYWTPGIVIFLLNSPAACTGLEQSQLIASVAICLVVNAVTLYVFFERPFRPEGVPGGEVSRFMY